MEKLFDLHEGDNIGGVSRIEIAHVTDFAGFRPVVFKPGQNWKEIPIVPLSSLLKSDEKHGDSGVHYSYAGTFKIHRPSDSKESILRRYVGPVSVLRVTDLNGYVRVIGSPAEPVTVSAKGDTGGKPGDMNHVQYDFSVTQVVPALT